MLSFHNFFRGRVWERACLSEDDGKKVKRMTRKFVKRSIFFIAVLLLSHWKTLTRPSLLGNYQRTMCLVVLLNPVLHYSKIVLQLLSKLNMIW